MVNDLLNIQLWIVVNIFKYEISWLLTFNNLSFIQHQATCPSDKCTAVIVFKDPKCIYKYEQWKIIFNKFLQKYYNLYRTIISRRKELTLRCCLRARFLSLSSQSLSSAAFVLRWISSWRLASLRARAWTALLFSPWNFFGMFECQLVQLEIKDNWIIMLK